MDSPQPYRYSLHARRQMARRRITEDEVDEAAEFVETAYRSAEHSDRMVILGRTAAGRRLKLVLSLTDPPVVVTVAARDEEG